jgi:adenosylhomocysteine nucleosidase
MRRELAPLLSGVRPQQTGGVEFFELNTAVVAVAGVGRAAATRATEAVVAKYGPGMIVSAGLVGAITPKLKAGDVVHVREVIDADSGVRFVSASGDGVLLTVSAVSGPEEKRKLAQQWQADVIDMEGAAVAEQSQRCGIAFLAVKGVSDELDFVLPPLGKFVSDAGEFETLRFLAYIAVRPRWWSDVRELNSNSRKATVNLCAALEHLTS